MARNPRTAVDAQLASNRQLVAIHAKSQMRLDQIRMDRVARSTAENTLIQAGGVARNVFAGLLPLETSHKVRRELARHVEPFTTLKTLRADAKARVLK